MHYLKVSSELLHSTTWRDPVLWRLMETAGLMAYPEVIEEPAAQLDVYSARETGFVVPAGRYGLARAAGIGIVHAAHLGEEEGMNGLLRLGAPEPGSRDQAYEGRRVVRVNGGFVVLNYAKFRDKDFLSTERVQRWRERQAGERQEKAAKKAPRPAAEKPPVTTWATPLLNAWTRGVLPVQQSVKALTALRKALPDELLAVQLIRWFSEHPDDRGRFGLDHLVKHWSAQLHEMQNGTKRGQQTILDIGREALRQVEARE